MDSKSETREKIISTLEENIMILNETLGNFSRMSIYNPDKEFFVEQTKKDIDKTMEIRQHFVDNKPLPINKNA